MFRWIKSRLTMKKIKRLFIDIDDLKPMYRYDDCYGNSFMAKSKFGYRIKITDIIDGNNNSK